ncbi:MAG: hypothetical protein ACXW25_02210, partial [Rhodospirillales bacterium]
PETAFHVRMIPALLEAGIETIIYDSIHRFRACKDYPYAGMNEGMLPPNPAEQVNPAVDDWLQLHNIWAGSKISPSLLRPEYVGYEDVDGSVHKMICVPAERYIGNEDARGGFGALQYPSVLGQVYDKITADGSFDPKHPPFFLLHSDGDNHGGGADSYYHNNTAGLVRWLEEDPRFELTTVLDYLERFPPDPAQRVHIEPGSWSGADNGDPQFMKWFSRYNEPYSPDLNSWAVLTAFQNMVHSLEDGEPGHPSLTDAIRLMLTAETSCYWYWTGQHVWDQQVTNAANVGHGLIKGAIAAIAGRDATPPTIFAPWVVPENPGGQTWGQGCLPRSTPPGRGPHLRLRHHRAPAGRGGPAHGTGRAAPRHAQPRPLPVADWCRSGCRLLHRRAPRRRRRRPLLHRGRGRPRQRRPRRVGADPSGLSGRSPATRLTA